MKLLLTLTYKKGPYELSVTACFAQIGCKEMELFKGENRFDPDWVFTQFLNYKDLTLTIKGKDKKIEKLVLMSHLNFDHLVKQLSQSQCTVCIWSLLKFQKSKHRINIKEQRCWSLDQ